MVKKSLAKNIPAYSLDPAGCFTIERYNDAKPFSNFFPGIAGIWGIPMWVFYVNRGQGISSFGIESKDKAILEFQPANKAYRLTSLQGFRTFIKLKTGSKVAYWEPFQENLLGTHFKKKQVMAVTAHDLTIQETNFDLGVEITVNYFTLPEEPIAALVRQISIKNVSKSDYSIELLDGLPAIVPYGQSEWLNKNLSRTVEAWVRVNNVDKKAPFYQLSVEVSDKPEVKHVREGNFHFSFDPTSGSKELLWPIIQSSFIFDQAYDFTAPTKFLSKDFGLPKEQFSSNRTPCAFSYYQGSLKKGRKQDVVSLYGYAKNIEYVHKMIKVIERKDFIEQKKKRNEEIVNEIRNYTFTQSSSLEFDLYARNTFLDNVLRGGLPLSLKTSEGQVSLNIYSRKHGDLERDYNHFVLAPTYYSQGNGNYRDVNQNRRNDIWFNKDVEAQHIISFLNLLQADGYNPLIVKGMSFFLENLNQSDELLDSLVHKGDLSKLKKYLEKPFLPGALLDFLQQESIRLKEDIHSFLSQLLEACKKQELAEHGEGYWTDHWTYNLDLIESYLAIYPEKLKELLLQKKDFYFYFDSYYILPRDEKYILTPRGVRQYKSVHHAPDEIRAKEKSHRLRIKKGAGLVYHTNLLVKLLCLVTNKIATLDPSGVGVEMEADKPNWYDALNGLPGLLGSSVSEALELKRLALFMLEVLRQVELGDEKTATIFTELFDFIMGMQAVLSAEKDPYQFWLKANDLKENYRKAIRLGIEGEEKQIAVLEIKRFLNLVAARLDTGIKLASTKEGFLATYFYHEVMEYEPLTKLKGGGHNFVRPLKFKRHTLPLFLEGYVHALRVEKNPAKQKELYRQVRLSPLFDGRLKMYKVNADLSTQTEDIGRCHIFPKGWLENESIWLHMEYKFMLELLKNGLYKEFYENFRNVFIPFLKPSQYARNILENSSFLVSSVHEDKALHGQGFVARLSGSTAEFIHMWLLMNMGLKPFRLNEKKDLVLALEPALAGWLFTAKPSEAYFNDEKQHGQIVELPSHTYSFKLLNSILVVYHNPKCLDTFGPEKASLYEIHLTYPHQKTPQIISGDVIPSPFAHDVRSLKVERIDVFFK